MFFVYWGQWLNKWEIHNAGKKLFGFAIKEPDRLSKTTSVQINFFDSSSLFPFPKPFLQFFHPFPFVPEDASWYWQFQADNKSFNAGVAIRE